jgi:hypothetical protein
VVGSEPGFRKRRSYPFLDFGSMVLGKKGRSHACQRGKQSQRNDSSHEGSPLELYFQFDISADR